MTRTAHPKFAHFIAEFSKKTVLVVGDVMLDFFVRGEVDRISPEAPVPVVLQTSRSAHLGGAGNTASNIAALGARTTLLGIVGSDVEGREIKRLARAGKINPRFVVDPKRFTTVKTRVAARHHQLLRIDRETHLPIRTSLERRVLAQIVKLPVPDVVVVSDYAKGVVSERVIVALKKRFGSRKLIADFKPAHGSFFKHIGAMKLNVAEVRGLTGQSVVTDREAAEAAHLLVRRFDAPVVITRGDQGMTVCDIAGRPTHIPAITRHIFDVTGAGDTTIAVIALMRAAHASLLDAARAANLAAGLAVSREGTTTISAKELGTLLRDPGL